MLESSLGSQTLAQLVPGVLEDSQLSDDIRRSNHRELIGLVSLHLNLDPSPNLVSSTLR